MNAFSQAKSWTFQLAAAMLLGLLLSLLIPAISKAGTIDAVSGASLSLSGGSTTCSTATFTWKEKYTNGDLRFFWDSANTSRSKMRDTVYQTGTSRPTTLTIPDRNRKLQPSTLYNYIIQGYWQGSLDASYVIKGSFKTDALEGTAGIFASKGSKPLGYRLIDNQVQLLDSPTGSLARWHSLNGILIQSQPVPANGFLTAPRTSGVLLLEVPDRTGRSLVARIPLTGR